MIRAKIILILLLYCCLSNGCATSSPSSAGLVEIRYNDYVSSAVVIEPNVVLGMAHAVPDGSNDTDAIRVGGMKPTAVTVLADGWANNRQNPNFDFFTIHSHLVREDFLMLYINPPLKPIEYNKSTNIEDAMRSAKSFYVLTRERSSQNIHKLLVKNIVYDTNNQVIQSACKEKKLNNFYLSGSPMISHNKDGTYSLLGLVSTRIYRSEQDTLLFINPINTALTTKEKQP